MKNITLIAAAAAVTLAIPGRADALTHYYTLTGPAGGYAAIWQLPERPMPDSALLGQGFALQRVSGQFPGTTQGYAYFDFFSADNNGGFSIADADGPDLLISLSGAQLYRGGEDAPEMLRGVFALSDGYTLTVADQAGAVPEPQTWALMVLGFGAVGGVLRARTRRVAVRFA